ncbi:hypothetical protein BH09PAT3_BH09PAT3_5870 [soil metagenome]
MIVLAVTGIMLAAVVTLINGKQQKAGFQTSINDIKSHLQQISSEVNSGYFQNDNTYKCSADPVSSLITLRKNTDPTAVSNGDCLFIGKAVHFYQEGSADEHIFSSFTIAGADDPAGSYAAARPFLIAPTAAYSSYNPDAVDITADEPLQYGLTAAWLKYTDNNGLTGTAGSFAFVQSLNAGVSSDLVTGGSSQHTGIIMFVNSASSVANNKVAETDSINSAFRSGEYNPGPGTGKYRVGGTVTICFNSGSTDQSGIIKISTESSHLDIKSNIYNGRCSTT